MGSKMSSAEWVEVKLSNLCSRLNKLRPASVMSIDFGKNTPTVRGGLQAYKKGSINFSSSSLANKLANPWQLKQTVAAQQPYIAATVSNEENTDQKGSTDIEKDKKKNKIVIGGSS